MKKIIVLAAGVVLTLAGIGAPAQAATPAHQHAIPQKPIVGVAGYQGGPLGSKTAFKALEDKQAAALTGPYFHYEAAQQSISTTTNGGATSLAVLASQHHPKIEPTNDGSGSHSLFEVAAQNQSGASTIEVGWTMDTPVCGQSVNPCLFVFSWVDSVPQGYNTSNPGWVDNPNETSVNAGTALASTASGAAPTAFYQYRIERVSSPAWCTSPCSSFGTGWQIIQKNQGASDRIIGGFKDSVWSSSAAGPFTAIDYLQIFGEQETATVQNGCTDGGSGVFGTSTEPSAAARVVAYSMVGAPAGTVNEPDILFVTASDTPTAYRLYQLPADHDQWKWGGPGYNAAGTGTGSIAAC
jgi:hypothetical protein